MQLIDGAKLGSGPIDMAGGDLEAAIEEDRKRKEEQARLMEQTAAQSNNDNSGNIFQKAGGIIQTGLHDIENFFSTQTPIQPKVGDTVNTTQNQSPGAAKMPVGPFAQPVQSDVKPSFIGPAQPQAPESPFVSFLRKIASILPSSERVNLGIDDPNNIQDRMMRSEIDYENGDSPTKKKMVEAIKNGTFGNLPSAPALIFGNTFLPLKFISDRGAFANEAVTEITDEYKKEHPFLSIVPQAVGEVANLLTIGAVGGGLGMEALTAEKAGGLGTLFPTATRMVGKGLTSGSIFGIDALLSTAIDQAKKDSLNVGELAQKTAGGFGTGLALGASGALGTATQRISAAASTLGGISLVEGYIKDGKITANTLINAGINAIVGAGFEALGGRNKSELFQGIERENMAQNNLISRIMQGGASPFEKAMGSAKEMISYEEAQKIALTLEQLPGKLGGALQIRAEQQLKEVPQWYQDLPAESKQKYYDNVVTNIQAGDTIPEAVQKTNLQLQSLGIQVPQVAQDKTNQDLTQYQEIQKQMQSETDPAKLDDLSNKLSQAKESLDQYIQTAKQTVVNIPNENGQPLLKIEVTPIGKGQFTASFDANTSTTGINAPFNMETLAKSKSEAVQQAATTVKNWASNEINSAVPSDVPILQKIITEAQNAMQAKFENTQKPTAVTSPTITKTAGVFPGQFEYGINNQQYKWTKPRENAASAKDSNAGFVQKRNSEGLWMVRSEKRFTSEKAVMDFIKQDAGVADASGGSAEVPTGKSEVEKAPILQRILQDEAELHKVYVQNGDKVAKALYEIYVELDIAEAGKKNFIWDDNKTGGEPTVIGEKSKFPQWIPEEYRSKALFDKVMGGLMDPENIKFPDKNKVKQREFYNLLLDEVDQRASIYTSAIREDIINNYNQIYEKTSIIEQKGAADTGGSATATGASNTNTNSAARQSESGNDSGAARSQEPGSPVDSEIDVDKLFKVSNENVDQYLDEKWVKSHLEKINAELNPNLRALVNFKVFESLKDKQGNILSGQAGKSGVDMARNVPKIVFKETIPHELEHFATTFLDKSDQKILLDYYRSLSHTELVKIFGSEARLNQYQEKYAKYKDPEMTMADETLRHDMDNERYFASRPIFKAIKKIVELISRVIDIINSQLSEKGKIMREFKQIRRLSTSVKREAAADIYREVFNPDIKLGEGRFGKVISPERLAELQNNTSKTSNIRFAKQAIQAEPSESSARFLENFGFNPKNLADPNSQEAYKETDKIIKRSEIAKELSQKLNVPIRRGKFRHAGAIGIYKPGPKVVRYKAGGLPTIFHEVGHFLDDNFKLSATINLTERRALMVEYGYKYEGMPEKQRKEAFAEFLRFRMTGQKAKATELAPHFSEVFDERMKVMPEIKQVLDTATNDFARWNKQPAVAKVLSQISFEEKKSGTIGERISYTLHDLYTMAKDDLHPLSQFSAMGSRILGKISAERDPYILARNMRGWVGKAETFLTKGTFGKKYWTIDEKGRATAKFTGKSYQEIMKPLDKAGKMDDFRVYIVSQRALELHARKIKTGISSEDARAAIAELAVKNPEFEAISEERRKYKDALLQYANENGLIGNKSLAKIKALNQFHVPFYRVMEETTTSFMGGKKLAGNINSPIKKIKGSDLEIIDPIESDIKDTYAIINAAERNNIGIAMANLAARDHELGRLFEKVDRPMQGTSVNVTEVLQKALQGNQELIDMIPEELGSEIVTIFRPTQDRGQNMLNVNVGDQHLVYQVDPDLFKALQGLNAEDVGMIMRVLAAPARLLRAGATLTPDFSVRNPIRDQFSALVYSKYGFIPGIDLVRGIFAVFKQGNTYDLWKMSGGEHSMLVSMDRDYLQESFTDLMRSKKGKAWEHVKHPIDLLRALSELGEQGTRLGEMSKALAAGANPIEAGYSSREVTLDFARIGAKTKAINAIIAFWNANVEGMDRMVRSFKDKPFRTLLKVLLGITLPSILLYFANRKDPRWKELPQWQKDLFWVVFTKDHIYRIPKPFELGVLFGSVPERIMEYMDTKDSTLFDQLEASVANGATPGFIPTSLLPIIENMTNYSLFLNRPIVPRGMEGLPAPAQSGTFTSETAKFLGNLFNYSPSKIDNLIQGYTGGLGKYTVNALDYISGKVLGKKGPVAPSAAFEDLPVIKSFTIRNPQGSSSESVNKVYNLYTTATGQEAYINRMIKDGNTDAAAAAAKQYPQVVYSKFLTETINQFSTINTERAQVRNDQNMSAAEKKSRTDQMDALQTQIAQQALDIMAHK